jgi:dTDP-4-dehydrorhamnose reductase
MNTILITGSSGLLGSSLVPYLKERDYKVVTHACNSQADFMFDLTDQVKSLDFLEKINPDLIINLAGLTSVELCEENINFSYLVNTNIVENLVCWMLKSKKSHLIQISTDHVYDGDGLHSEDKVNLTNNYAFSKYAAELVALRVNSSILRTNFIGRSNSPTRESLSDWVYKSCKTGKPEKVLDDVYFSPLSIKILIEIIELFIKEKPLGIFNLGSHNGMSKADFDFKLAKFLGLPAENLTRIKSDAATFLKAYRPKNMIMDSSKFENLFRIRLPDLESLIEEIAKDYEDLK